MPDVVDVNCSNGQVGCRPQSAQEQAAASALAAAYEQGVEAAAQQHATLVAAVQASTDPALLALAQLVGVLPASAAASSASGTRRS